MGKRKTHEEYVKQIEDKYGIGTYEVLSDYINAKEPIKLKHVECETEFEIIAENMLKKSKTKISCPKCDRNFNLPNEHEKLKVEYEKEGYHLISDYKNSKTKVIAICPNGHEWDHYYNNFRKGARCRDCSSNKKIELDEARNEFIKRGLTPIFNSYKNNCEQLTFICNIHPEYGEQHCQLSNLKLGKICCKGCQHDKISGENSVKWKGGVTPIKKLIREYIFDNWTLPSLKKYNYTCVLTGKKDNLEVHHVYQNFHVMFEKALETLNLKNRNNLGDCTQQEIDSLKKLMLKLHNECGLGIPLTREIHKLFHHIYGYKNNNVYQFKEFERRYNNGEFDDYLKTRNEHSF